MISASKLLYEQCGSPPVDGCEPIEPQPCWVCGAQTHAGIHWKKWSGSTFVDQNRIRGLSGEYVCPACVFLASRTSPVPGRPPKEGKKFGGNFRNYSHLLDADGYTNASKGEKPHVLAWLRRSHRGPWFAAVADSGQKHIVPFCPVNPDGCVRGVIMFDETPITLPGPNGWSIVDEATALLTAGVTKAELESGEYTARAWTLVQASVDLFENRWSHLRGGPWFKLVVWLAQRDEDAVAKRIEAEKESKRDKKASKRKEAGAERKRKAADANGRGDAGPSRGVPKEGSKLDNALDAARNEDAQRGTKSSGSGRMVQSDAERTPNRRNKHGQLSLFG